MNKKSIVSMFRKIGALLLVFCICTATVLCPAAGADTARAADGFTFLVLSSYSRSMNIGESFYLVGVASNGKTVKWKSSNSRVASVNTYGQVTAKSAGTCKITGKVPNAEASCKITVNRTEITLSRTQLTLENGAFHTLRATTSSGSPVVWKSSKKSIATIDENGCIEALKPGTTSITASADGTSRTCRVSVKKPDVTLNSAKVSLYRGQTYQLEAEVSSGRAPVYASKKTSVATVDDTGLITAQKHGSATIQVKVDGVVKTCTVTVKPPEIVLTPDRATLKVGKSVVVSAKVSSGFAPEFRSSKSSVADVDNNGKVKALKKGTCYIYASEDGAKASCKITVQ